MIGIKKSLKIHFFQNVRYTRWYMQNLVNMGYMKKSFVLSLKRMNEDWPDFGILEGSPYLLLREVAKVMVYWNLWTNLDGARYYVFNVCHKRWYQMMSPAWIKQKN